MQHANSSRLFNCCHRSNTAVVSALVVAIFLLAATATASAGGPRWVSGPPYFTNWHVNISWYTNHPAYFTDPGDLSPSVNHAAADVMVAKAASVWNVQTASLVLAQGGTLDEHLSGANVYASANGPVFPADVQTTNYAAKQIAVIYDSDGSITDMLLGSGASDPSGCLQGGVTESVDSITREAQIQHAILILNGRCTGPEAEKQTQMQYQLMRAFGRILGLAWSQTNDNVFTGSPAPTHMQAMNWPIMHPIDIICGPYSYQCLPEPFTLRADDISALEQLYFIQDGGAAPGKLPSWSNAGSAYGRMTFPNGQGMEGVNVVVRRVAPFWQFPEEWQTASLVTGNSFRGQTPTSITSPGNSPTSSMGFPYVESEGYWRIVSIPVPQDQGTTNIVISTEPINPLYTGPYAIGPVTGNTMSPSGSAQEVLSYWIVNGRQNGEDFTPVDAASTCSTPADGSEDAPAAVSQGGWWTGTICGYGHSAWSLLPVKANRTFTLEVTALDEKGYVSMTKAMPILGVWNSTDVTGTLPTVASAATAFNSLSVGMTTLNVQSSTSASFRIDIQDQRGAGRPDFAYQARALYADTVTPSNISAGGGDVTITGMGFRRGNVVLVNGTAAIVTSWSPTRIVATLPSLRTLGLSEATVTTITVQDISTGGSSVMTDVVSYASPVEVLQLVSSPAGTVATEAVASTTFSVRAIAPDGYTSIVGEAISFVAAGAGAKLNQCPSSPCIVLTNASGIASVSVRPTASGVVMLTATGRSGTASTSFTAMAEGDVLHLLSAPSGIATVGSAAVTPLRLQLLLSDAVTPHSGSGITLTLLSGAAQFSGCQSVPCTLISDAAGMALTTVTPTSSGAILVQFSFGSSSVTASFSAAPKSMRLTSAPNGTQTIGAPIPAAFAVKVVGGDGITPVSGEAVVFTASGAAITFSACGGAVCTLTTDAQGIAQSPVTAAGAGPVTLSAVGSAGTATAAFTAVLPSGGLQTVSAQKGSLYLGDRLPDAFTVRLTMTDGITPISGRPVTFQASAGAEIFGACNAPVCIVLTDTAGLASTSVSVTEAGEIGLLATAGAGSATAAFTVATRVRLLTVVRPVQYIAEGARVTWTPRVTLADNSASTSNLPVSWTGAPGLSLSASSSMTGAAGAALGSATAGPLADGDRAQGDACAWVNVCSPLVAQGVGAHEWRLAVVSGTGQSVSRGETLAAVVLRVVNADGDPVAGVLVQIDQIVSEWEAACPDAGRCPIASTITSTKTSGVSDMDGLLSVLPTQVAGVPAVTRIAIVAGMVGFATLSLETHP